MGTSKNNLKPKEAKHVQFFEGIKARIRPKTSDSKTTAKSYVDLVLDMEKRNNELIIAKARDVEREPDRYAYNQVFLVELQIQETLISQIIESLARASDAADKDSGKH